MNYLGVYAAGVATPIALWFMLGRCLVCQRNVWRGFSIERDLVGDMQITLGVATFLVTRRPMLDRLWAMLKAAEGMRQ